MLVKSINQNKLVDGCEVVVEIQGFSPLVTHFSAVEEIKDINDFVLLNILFSAMTKNRDIVFPSGQLVSKALVENIEQIQDIFSHWFPSLHKVKVQVETKDNDAKGEGVCSLFSGGADSFYSLINNQQTIDTLLFCFGLDIQLDEEERLKSALTFNQEVADQFNKKLIVVTTNLKSVFDDFNASKSHGAVLASFALAMGYKQLYIPASFSYSQTHPWGSHQLTDPLYSNGVTRVIHDGPVERPVKIELISQSQFALDRLRVCNSEDEYNCGRCEKCIRTMFSLAVLNKQSNALPPFDIESKEIKNLKIFRLSQEVFWLENLRWAEQYKRDSLAKYARQVLRNYQLKTWLKQGKQLLLNKHI